MSIFIDFGYRSLRHFGEELCGDKVDTARYEDNFIGVLSDGMGSGVKANILATMTGEIITTMLTEGESIESAVETVVNTLPVCSVRNLAYSTFSIVQVDNNGQALLVEFDNPQAFIIRRRQIIKPDYDIMTYSDKSVFETSINLMEGDWIIIASDGVINAGQDNRFNFSWTWNNVARWLCDNAYKHTSALRLSISLLAAVNDLYGGKPTDDATVMVIRVPLNTTVNIMYGPPEDMNDDARMVTKFLESNGIRIVCGGTTASIVARFLGKEISIVRGSEAEDIPPMSHLDGIDIVTEGVITVTRAYELIKQYFKVEYEYDDFERLDGENGAAKLARQLIEDCSQLNLFIGTARNTAHDKASVPIDMTTKMKSIDGICAELENHGRIINKKYY